MAWHVPEIVLKDIEFTSLCQHHLMPFSGVVHIGYLPQDGMVVGVSKLARLVDIFARRLQVQENMGEDISCALLEHVSTLGIGVVIEATHCCLSCRGARKPDAVFVTSSMNGGFRDNPALRAEFLSIIGR